LSSITFHPAMHLVIIDQHKSRLATPQLTHPEVPLHLLGIRQLNFAPPLDSRSLVSSAREFDTIIFHHPNLPKEWGVYEK